MIDIDEAHPPLHCTLPGKPTPWKRRLGSGSNDPAYRAAREEAAMRLQVARSTWNTRYSREHGRWDSVGSLDGFKLSVQFFLPRPADRDGFGPGVLRSNGGADTDNLTKLVMDALERSGVVKNDRLISEVRASKHYHALPGSNHAPQSPCVVLTLERL